LTTEYITLDVWNTEDIKVKVNQREVNARFLEVQFIDKNQPLNLEDKRVFFFAKKPDGNLIFNRCEIVDENDGKVNLALTSQMSIVDGIMEDCEFDIIATDLSRLKVKGLILEIEKCTDFDSATESTSEFTALEEAIAGYERASDTIDAHIADKNNPHEVTATQIGAAESNHTHSTSDILSGTLSIARGGTNATVASDALANLGGVSNTRTINSKALSSNITLDASDVGAVPTTRTINSKALSSNVTLSASDVGAAESNHTHSTSDITSGTLPIARGGTNATTANDALANLGGVPTTRTINSKALSSNITLNAPDIGAASYEVKYEEDFNNIKTPGLYTMVMGDNRPTGDMCHSLFVNRSYDEDDFVQQIAIKESTYEVYMRYCSNTFWSNWKKFSMDGHSHGMSDITSGILPITKGGTGATTASAALSALGGLSSSDIVCGTIVGDGQASKVTTLPFAPKLFIVFLINQPPIKYDSNNGYYLYNFAIGNSDYGCTKGMVINDSAGTSSNVTLKQSQSAPADGIFLNLNKNYSPYIYIAIKNQSTE